jgi:hypothetical protein
MGRLYIVFMDTSSTAMASLTGTRQFFWEHTLDVGIIYQGDSFLARRVYNFDAIFRVSIHADYALGDRAVHHGALAHKSVSVCTDGDGKDADGGDV